jgi:hypothetical protein
LCLVSARFWNAFAPRLWRDPLWSARQLGLDPGDGTLTQALLTNLVLRSRAL